MSEENNKNPLVLFLKAWKRESLQHAVNFAVENGFDGVELPIREGFWVNPDNAKTELPNAVRLLEDHGLQLSVVGTEPTSEMMEILANLDNPPMIRKMVAVAPEEDYLEAERHHREELARIYPHLKSANLKLALQNHDGNFVASARAIRVLLDDFEPGVIGACWDPAHSDLAGEIYPHALSILWDYLFLVNLKNPEYRRMNGVECRQSRWFRFWTSGRMGLTNWRKVLDLLKSKGYDGPINLFAEYNSEEQLEYLVKEDLRFYRELCQELDF